MVILLMLAELFLVWAYANSAATNTSTLNIPIPLTATVGQTVIRIVCVESSTVSPCGTYTWGSNT